MPSERELSDEQEAQRLEGLRKLARIIARHALAHPDRYGDGESGDRRATPASSEQRRKDGAA